MNSKKTAKTKNKPSLLQSSDSKTLIEIGKLAAKKAIQESKALGLAITFLEDGIIYKELPDGKRIKIGEVPSL
jgi:hypothetical protein